MAIIKTVPIDHIGLIRSNSNETNNANMAAINVFIAKIRSSLLGRKASICFNNMNSSQIQIWTDEHAPQRALAFLKRQHDFVICLIDKWVNESILQYNDFSYIFAWYAQMISVWPLFRRPSLGKERHRESWQSKPISRLDILLHNFFKLKWFSQLKYLYLIIWYVFS